jgi:hypothetical protein
MPGQIFAYLFCDVICVIIYILIFFWIYRSWLCTIALVHMWQARIRLMKSTCVLNWRGRVTPLCGVRFYCIAWVSQWAICVWFRCVALLLTHNKGLCDSSSNLILCQLDTSRLRKTAIMPCSVRNKLIHMGNDQSMKCVYTVLIASRKPVDIWYIDM